MMKMRAASRRFSVAVVMALCVVATASAAAGVFTASGGMTDDGKESLVVVLVESFGDVEGEIVQKLADAHGAAVALESGSVFTPDGNSTLQMVDAITAASVPFSVESFHLVPIVAFGSAANIALNLSYAGWGTVVAVCPSLDSLYLPPRNLTVEEADAAPIVLLVSDVDVNGPFVTGTEAMLDAAGIHWETMRFGGTSPGFYHLDSEDYKPAEWARASEAIDSFIADNIASGTPGSMNPGEEVPAGVTVESPFLYLDGAIELEGYLAYPTEAVAAGMMLPAVVILPDADGLEGYEFARAHMLAKMGYVALGANSYGLPVGASPATRDERSELINLWRGNPELYVERIRSAISSVRDLPFVNASAIGMTGYCFGGSGVVFDVLANSDIQVDVSFHGGLSVQPNVTTMPPAKPYLAFQSGGADESPEEIAWLQERLTEMGGQWDITRYSKVLHAFTVWAREDRYHPRADGRSWEAMAARFQEFMPSPAASKPMMMDV